MTEEKRIPIYHTLPSGAVEFEGMVVGARQEFDCPESLARSVVESSEHWHYAAGAPSPKARQTEPPDKPVIGEKAGLSPTKRKQARTPGKGVPKEEKAKEPKSKGGEA
ncbi:MAG: hypothetical protein VW405_02890 [Rhodospirillaceae bacterium]